MKKRTQVNCPENIGADSVRLKILKHNYYPDGFDIDPKKRLTFLLSFSK